MPKVDLSKLTDEQREALFQTYLALVETMLAANNTLIVKLSECEDTTNQHVEILNDWSGFINSLQEAHSLEVEKAISSLN